MIDNNYLRKEALKKRDNLSDDMVASSSQIIADKLLTKIESSNYSNILCFYPIRNEVNLLSLYDKLLKKGYNLYLPVTYKDDIRFFRIDNLSNLSVGRFGIYEPIDRSCEYEGELALSITPGLVFDKKLNRLGYGRGYYDRFLSKYDLAYPVGVCYRFQIVEHIDTTRYDVPMRQIITD